MSGIAFPGCQVTIATARGSSAPAKTGADFCSLPVWGDSHTGSGAVAPGPSGLTFRPRFVALAAGHMALLETFKYKNFVAAEDLASFTDSKGGNLPRFNGDPTKLMEYSWRVRARIAREQLLPEDERKKCGPLGLRLAEHLSGPALRVAQLMSTSDLAAEKGAETLLKKLGESLKPRRIQEARELYQAGAQPGGVLSRQPQEPMATYLVRRQAWHSAMIDLNSDLKLPDLILAEQTLTNAGISESMQLLIRSAIGGDMTLEKVSTELIAQHARIHEREHGASHHRGKGYGKHWRSHGSRSQHHGYMAEETYEWETAEAYQAENDNYGDGYDEADYDHGHEDEPVDEGQLLAMLADDGLDLGCEESMEYAADVIQADLEAFYARDRAVQKGIKGFKGKGKGKGGTRHFDVSGQLSLSERQQKLQLLKAKTSCRRCGQVGHWSGDPACPKGKGKSKTFATTSTPDKGDGKNKHKPRTVYFAVHDDGGSSGLHGFMAQKYNAVPPPSSLQEGQYVDNPTARGLPAAHGLPAARAQGSDDVPAQYAVVPSLQNDVSDGSVLTTEELDNMMLVNALGVAETRDDGRVIYEMPSELAGYGLPRDLQGLSGLFRDLPRLPERLEITDFDHAARSSQPVTPERPSPVAQVPQAAAQQLPAELPAPAPAKAASPAAVCRHVNVTTRGSNGYYHIKKCLDCGVTLSREPKMPTTAASTPPNAPDPAGGTCTHRNVTWHGTNGYRWRRTCRDCGEVRTGPVGTQPASSTTRTNARASSSSVVMPGTVEQILTVDQLPRLRQMLDFALRTKETHSQAGQEIASTELHMLLDYAIGVSSMDAAPPVSEYQTPRRSTTYSQHSATPKSRASASTLGPAEHLDDMGQRIVNFGKFKNQTYYQAWCDLDYVEWALQEEQNVLRSGKTMSSGLRHLCHYFKEMRRSSSSASAPAVGLMAVTEPSSQLGSEDDLIAILDTGCNATCHGSQWYDRFIKATGAPEAHLDNIEGSNMRGIGGNMKVSGRRLLEVCFELADSTFARGTMPSLELQGSQAPLLLSLETQRQLGFKIDIPNHVVYSSTLGSELKLVQRDGLLAIRLIPSYLGLSCTHESGDSGEQQLHGKDAHGDHQNTTPEVEEEEDELPLTPEVHLPVDELSKTVLTKGQKKQLKDTIQDVKETDNHMWDCLRATHHLGFRRRTLPKGCKTFLLEIFAGAALLSMIAADCGLPVSQPVDVTHDGIDLKIHQHRAQVERQIEADDPYCISFSPVCGPWSPWQFVNASRDPSFAEHLHDIRMEWRPVIKWIVKIIRQRLQRGRQVVFEQPWPSQMWNLLCVQMLLQDAPTDAVSGEHLEAVRCDQCMFGLADEQNYMPHKKPTGIMTASAGVKQCLNITCDGSHQHHRLEGSSRTHKAQHWPLDFCKAILTGLLQDLETNMTKVAFPAEAVVEDNPLGSLDMIYEPSDMALESDGKHRADDHELQLEEHREESAEAVAAQDAIRKQEWLKLPYAQRVAVRRLHQMTGHASTSAMGRMLRVARASPEVLHKLKFFKCEACQQTKRPEPRPVVRPPNPYTFNHEISADCLEVRDAIGNRYTVFSVICLGTLYHCAWIVSDQGGTPSSLKCAEALRDGWLTIFGAPRFLTVDRGVANRGRLAELVNSQGIYLRFAEKEAAHQIGRCERHGGILKEMVSHAVQSRNVVGGQHIRMVVSECCFVKNNRINNGGFSPSQWVLGRMPVEICSLTTEQGQEELGVHEEILTGENQFAQQLNIRQAAKESFAHVDSSQKVRTALTRRSTPLRGPYHPGDLLCFHREGRWYGPARMIGREGRSNLWLIHGGIPIVIAEEKVRPALAGEVIAKQLTELKPQRKRKRQVLQDDVGEDEVPFGDDLDPSVGIGDEDDQGSFFHLGRGGGEQQQAEETPVIPALSLNLMFNLNNLNLRSRFPILMSLVEKFWWTWTPMGWTLSHLDLWLHPCRNTLLDLRKIPCCDCHLDLWLSHLDL